MEATNRTLVQRLAREVNLEELPAVAGGVGTLISGCTCGKDNVPDCKTTND